MLEREVIPEFYERDENGMPSKWLRRVRESMTRLTSEFSASRAIREYTESHYLPAASGYRDRAATDSKVGASLLQWQQNLARHWNMVRFGTVNVETRDGQHFFRVEVFPGGLKPDALRVELYADPVQGSASALVAMTASQGGVDSSEAQIYCAQVSACRPTSDYTPRIVPYHPSATIPLEATQILWQR